MIGVIVARRDLVRRRLAAERAQGREPGACLPGDPAGVSESFLAPPAALRGGELVLVVGNLTIDDVVLPTGVTRMATLGGNSVHAATAVVTAGAKAALIARRGDDFPSGALAALAEAGVDLSGLVEIAGPTVRNWVVYEEDGSRRWLYRTPARPSRAGSSAAGGSRRARAPAGRRRARGRDAARARRADRRAGAAARARCRHHPRYARDLGSRAWPTGSLIWRARSISSSRARRSSRC